MTLIFELDLDSEAVCQISKSKVVQFKIYRPDTETHKDRYTHTHTRSIALLELPKLGHLYIVLCRMKVMSVHFSHVV